MKKEESKYHLYNWGNKKKYVQNSPNKLLLSKIDFTERKKNTKFTYRGLN